MLVRQWIVMALALGAMAAVGTCLAGPARTVDDEALEARCLSLLRDALNEAQEIVKVHAAEVLIWSGYPQGVEEEFVREEKLAKPGCRIAVWRVLAQVAWQDSLERDSYMQKIRDVYRDATSGDRLTAIETLAKLRDQELLPDYRRDSLATQGLFQSLARWAAANSRLAEDEAAFTQLLGSTDKDVRARVGYGLRSMPEIGPETMLRLKAAARAERVAAVRVYLVSALYVHSNKAARAKWRKGLLDYLKKGDSDQKCEAALGLSYGCDRADLPALEASLADPELEVRVSASQAILRILKNPVEWGYRMPAMNAILNSGFEQDAQSWRTWPRRGQPGFAIDSQGAHTGTRSARIRVTEAGADGSWVQTVKPVAGATYQFSFWFRTEQPNQRVVFLAEFVAGGGGYAGQFKQVFVSTGTEWTKASGRFPVAANVGTMDFEVWVNLDGSGVTTAWFDDCRLEVLPAELVLADVPIVVVQPAHRVLRAAKQEVVVRIPWPEEAHQQGEYELWLEREGVTLARFSGRLDAQLRQAFKGRWFSSDGVYAIKGELRHNGQSARPVPAVVVRRVAERAPRGAAVVGDDGVLRVDGKPFFPLGVYNVPSAKWSKFQAQGFNTVHGAPGDGFLEAMKTAEGLGLKVYVEMSYLMRGTTDLSQVEGQIKQLRDSPALLGYHAPDEPGVWETPLRYLQEAYNLYRSLDPYHPVVQVYCDTRELERYGLTADIIMMDPYGDPAQVADWVRYPVQWQRAEGVPKGVWATLRAFPFPDLPSPQRVKLDTTLALINGAQGIMYFNHDYPPDYRLDESPLWEPFKELNRETMAFAPVVLCGERLAVSSGEKTVSQVGMWSYDGALWVLAANCTDGVAELSFALPASVAPARPIEVLYEQRTLPASITISDSFIPYGTHAYRIVLDR